MTTFLFALSTTEVAPEVINQVVKLAAAKKAKLVTLFVADKSVPQTVFQRLTDIGFIGEKPSEELEKAVNLEYQRQAKELLAEVKTVCTKQGVDCDTKLIPGSFAETVLQTVAASAADLLILLRERRSFLSRLFATSAIETIIYQAPCEIKIFEA